jgi:hypothetical protein
MGRGKEQVHYQQIAFYKKYTKKPEFNSGFFVYK